MSENLDRPLDENPASQRHWLYGFNSVVLVVVGLVVLIFILRICELDSVKNATKFDWSSNGANSLSPGTKKMLKDLGNSKEKYVIWSLYTDASDQTKREDPSAAAEQTRRRQQISDLLHQYAAASGNIQIDEKGDASRESIEREIRARYAGDFKPYEEAVTDYGNIVKDLSKFLSEEAAAIGAFGQKPGIPADDREQAAAIQARFASFPTELQQDQHMIQRETDMDLPDWGMLADRIKATVGDIEVLFDLLSDTSKMKSVGLPDTFVSYFSSANQKYKSMDKKLNDYMARLNALEPLKVQDVLSLALRDTVVVMNDKSAKVISDAKIYANSTDQQGRSQGLEFNGEQAISSALYSMANPNKVKVVFVTATPQHLLGDMYSDMKLYLEDSNFEVLEWSPPDASTGGGPPPASGKGVVWVVFTPDPPNMQMMMMGGGMPDTAPVVAATRDHMNNGGAVLFMADAAGSLMGPGTFPYADLIKDFGIEVQSKYTVVHYQESTDPDTNRTTSVASPSVGYPSTLTVVPNEITTPINGRPMAFSALRGDQGMMGPPTPVRVLATLPTGVWAQELVKTPYSPEYWAESDYSSSAKFNKGTDLESPIPLMAIAVKDKGKKAADGSSDEKRVAVIGAKLLGSNPFFEASEPRMEGNVIYRAFLVPGNRELMRNTVLWLAGYENMIAVSAKADSAQRIGNVSPAMMLMVRLGVWIFIPVLTLAIGWIVMTMRRRA